LGKWIVCCAVSGGIMQWIQLVNPLSKIICVQTMVGVNCCVLQASGAHASVSSMTNAAVSLVQAMGSALVVVAE